MFAGLHKGKDALDEAIDAFGREAKLLPEVGAQYLVHLPEQYTDMHTGAATAEPPTSTRSSGRTGRRAPTSWAG